MSNPTAMIASLTKHFGKGVIRAASEMDQMRRIKCSAIPVIDYITGGGYPIGRVIEHVGMFSSTKSYVAYLMLAEFQYYDFANHRQNAFYGFETRAVKLKIKAKKLSEQADDEEDEPAKPAKNAKGKKVAEAPSFDTSVNVMEIVAPKMVPGYKPKLPPVCKRVALVDLEGTYTKEWGTHIGIDNDTLLLIQPDTLNQAVDIVIALLSDPDISLVVFDSMGAVGPDAESEASMDKEQMGVAARFWNKAMRNIQAAINRNPAKTGTLIMINAFYEKIGFVLGDPDVIKHGNQMRLTKSVSIKFTALKEIQVKLDTGDVTGGRNIKIKCLKNKAGTPLRTSEFYYSYVDDGLNEMNRPDTLSQWVGLGLHYGLVQRSASNYAYKNLKVKGRDNFIAALGSSSELAELETAVYEAILEDSQA